MYPCSSIFPPLVILGDILNESSFSFLKKNLSIMVFYANNHKTLVIQSFTFNKNQLYNTIMIKHSVPEMSVSYCLTEDHFMGYLGDIYFQLSVKSWGLQLHCCDSTVFSGILSVSHQLHRQSFIHDGKYTLCLCHTTDLFSYIIHFHH